MNPIRNIWKNPPDVGLIGYGRAKTNGGVQARNAYLGNLFRAALRFSELTFNETYILSSQQGLLSPTAHVLPYERPLVTLGPSEKLEWGQLVVESIANLFPVARPHFHILAGKLLARPIIERAARDGYCWEFSQPLAGLSLRQRLTWLQRMTVFHVEQSGTR